jgi:hypothetical protein
LILRRIGEWKTKGICADPLVCFKSENGRRWVWCVSANVRQNARQRPEIRIRMRNGQGVAGTLACDDREDHLYREHTECASRLLCAFRAGLALSISPYPTPLRARGYPPAPPTAAASWTPAGPGQTGTSCPRPGARQRRPPCDSHHNPREPARPLPSPTAGC